MNSALVTIHGVGRIRHDFWRAQRQAVSRHLANPLQCHPVWWGDLIDAGARLPAARDRLVRGAQSVARRLAHRSLPPAPRLLSGITNGLHAQVNNIAGVLAYLLPNHRREVIRQRLRQTLTELAGQGREIVLVSESMGSVIAFDLLRSEADRYPLRAWLTLGCPLRLLVRSGRRPADLGAITPGSVGAWLNLYAPCDPIAAPIASIFPTYPVQDERIDGSGGLLRAHANYWTNPRVTRLIAGRLEA
jgi:hypothetical protein